MNSIRSKLTRHLMAWLALLLLLGLGATYFAIWRAVVKSFDVALRSRALAVSALTEWEDSRVQFDFSPDFLRGFGADHPHNYFDLRDANGVALARSTSLGTARLALPGEGSPDRPYFGNLTLPNGRSGRAVAFSFVPVATPETAQHGSPTIHLVVALDRGGLNETLAALFAAVAGCGAGLLVAVLIIVPRVLRGGLAPLDELAHQAERIDAPSLASRFPVDTLPVELRPIVGRLNDLLARLEIAFERERRYSADLAHELRTPVAELRSAAECALKWPEERDPEFERDVIAIAGRMETLVTRMLALTRGERGKMAVALGPVEMATAVAEAWKPFALRAKGRGLAAEFAVVPATMAADPDLLRSVLVNLLDNAVEYAPDHTQIAIIGSATRGAYEFRVANATVGLGPGDVARIFDRFWRKEPARTGHEHFGLGLSLAQAFAAAMDWRLTAEFDSSRRITFVLASNRPAGI